VGRESKCADGVPITRALVDAGHRVVIPPECLPAAGSTGRTHLGVLGAVRAHDARGRHGVRRYIAIHDASQSPAPLPIWRDVDTALLVVQRLLQIVGNFVSSCSGEDFPPRLATPILPGANGGTPSPLRVVRTSIRSGRELHQKVLGFSPYRWDCVPGHVRRNIVLRPWGSQRFIPAASAKVGSKR
jgi:hypothetical protein